MAEAIDITGQRFGRLVVVDRAPNRNGVSRAYWNCICDCGNETTTSGSRLRNGQTRSCGCLQIEAARDMGQSPEYTAIMAAGNVVHGHKRKNRRTLEYDLWLQIKRRCTDKSHRGYPRNGAMGIRMCKAWDDSFEQFLADIGEKPSPDHILVRIDRRGDYTPENCKWRTREEDRKSPKGVNIPISVGGLDFPSISAAARHFGMDLTTVLKRIDTGIDPQDAITQPARSMKSRRTRESYLPRSHPDRANESFD